MRRLKFLMAALFLSAISCGANAAPAPAANSSSIAEYTFNDTVGTTTQTYILSAYQRALAVTKPNALKTAVADLKRDVDGTGTVSDPTEHNILFLENGRGGAGSYSGEVLLAVPVSLDGTGLIDSTGLLLRVAYSTKIGQTVTVTIKEIVQLKTVK
jgi:hypothetical protein